MPRATVTPIFVDRTTAAALCSIGIDKWEEWVKRGIVPGPVIRDNQTIRWHWPSVEDSLAGSHRMQDIDPSVAGANGVNPSRRRHVAA
ncbi:MAG: hypothetical protein ACKVON_08085 [Beijerinckiaceae bacterium]